MAGSFQALPPARGQRPLLPLCSQERGWEPVSLLAVLWVGVPDLNLGGSPWPYSSTGTLTEGFIACVTSAVAGQGLEEMDAHLEIWGCPDTGKKRRVGKPLAQVPGVCMGPPHQGQLQKEELGANPLLRGLCQEGAKERSPAGDRHGSGALAWQRSSSTATAAKQQPQSEAFL